MQDEGVWAQTVQRLDQRHHPKWDSLSWVALRPLISAINDRVNWAAPRLVLDLRAAWLAGSGHQPDGDTYDGVADRTDATSFVLLGDTGEQDASQYVVGPALEAALLADDGPAFAVICSDVIYPSGDINDYIHGFYLPYEHLLRPGAAPGRPQRVYALPGNHDWYDGLTGFMHTFCRADQLDASTYAWPAAGSVPATGPGSSRWRRAVGAEGLGRMLWRRPSPAKPAPFHRGEPPTTLTALRDELMPEPAPGTGQPGPYFAIQLDGLLVVCIDGGIGLGSGDSMIDAAQGRWLLRMAQRPGPKILLTGYPLLVNGEWKRCEIDGAQQGLARGSWTGPVSVNDVVATPEYRFIAAIGGDIHNFQHYRVHVGGEPGHQVTYLVSGGGGAYISATHPVRTAAELRDARAIDPPPDAPQSAPLPSRGEHGMIPSPELSLSHFSDEVLPATWRLIRLMFAFVLGGLAAAGVHAWVSQAADPVMWTALGVAAAGVVVRSLVPGIAPSRRDSGHRTRVRVYRAWLAACGLLLGVGSCLAAWRLGPQQAGAYLSGWGVATVVAAVLATLQRRSGWWREPARDQRPGGWWRPGHPRSADQVLSAAILALLTVTGAAAVLLAAFGVAERSRWLIAAAAVLVLAAVGGWLIRRRPWWRRQSQTIALGVQLLAALFVFSAAPGVFAAWRPWGVVAGALLDVVLLVIAVAVAAGAVLAAAGVTAAVAGGDNWRIRVGRWGHVVPWSIAALVVAMLAGLTLLTGTGLTGRSVLARSALGTAWGLALLTIGVFGLDSLRRGFPVAYRWFAVPLASALAVAVLLGQAQGHWLATELLILALGWTLSVITVSAGYLAFLGGHRLILDRPAHRDREDRFPAHRPLITEQEARQVLAWRESGEGGQHISARVRGRARFVAPSTDQPRGIIQQKVSEFFSTDRPPFFQHFLTLRVTSTTLEITPQVVTGQAPVPADTRATISIPLTRPRAPNPPGSP
jgi:hypothetical protein